MKRIASILAVLSVLAGLWFGIISVNIDAVSNLLHHRVAVPFTAENITYSGFIATENGFTGTKDSEVLICFQSPTFVNNLVIPSEGITVPKTIQVFYTTEENESFSEKNSVLVRPVSANSDYLLSIGKEVVSLSIHPSTSGECFVQSIPETIVINSRTVHFQSTWLFLALIAALLLVILADFIADRREIARELRAIFRYRFLLNNLVSRDIKTKYRRSILGILWSVLNPLLMMLVLTTVFSTIFQFRTSDFSVYYLTGSLLFNFFSESTTLSMTSIIQSSGLIKKVYVPKLIFPLEKCLYGLVNMLFSLIAAVIVFLIVGVTPHWTMLLFIVPILYLFVFNFGLSLIVVTMNTFFRDIGYLYSVLITVWMYLTPIIYPISILPAWALPFMRLNPLYHYIEYFRNVTLYGVLPGARDNLICIGFSLVFLLLGLFIFRKKQNKFIFYI